MAHAGHRAAAHNVFEVFLDRPLRHPLEASHQISEVFGPLADPVWPCCVTPVRQRQLLMTALQAVFAIACSR